MFNIAVKPEDNYLTYILKDLATDSRLEMVPSRGGIVTNWTIQGQQILYLDKERFKNPTLTVRGGIPILFPICGNLPNNIFSYNGREYIIKQHGFARDLPWEFVNQSQDNSARITLRLTSNPDTLAIYPFAFELNFTYELIGRKLIIHQEYTNKSSEEMPFSAGFHPYFYTPDKSQITLEIPARHYYDKTGETRFPFDGHLDFQLPEIDVFFTDLTENRVSFRDLKRKLRVTIFLEEFFSTIVFWTLKDKEFICIEPWSSPRNSINTKEKLKHLKPGESCRTKLEIEVGGLQS